MKKANKKIYTIAYSNGICHGYDNIKTKNKDFAELVAKEMNKNNIDYKFWVEEVQQ